METEENKPKNIYQKLLSIQKHVNGLAKDKKSNTYSYVTGDKVLGIVKPLMNELGLLLKQEVTSIENERMDYKTGIGTQYEKPKSEILSKVMMRFTWIDTETGEKDINEFGANGQNEWEKGLGSALTYAERYFILKYFHIATDQDDIDNDSRKQKDPELKEPTEQEIFELALSEVKNATDTKQLTSIYNKNKSLHANEVFIKEIKDKRESLKPQKNE